MKVPLVDLGRQHALIRDEVMSGLTDVMMSTSFIGGEDVGRFERAFAEFSGVAHCVGVGSGTDALEIAVRALGLRAGDQVIVPANSFIASALAVIRAGVDVVLVDCVPDTYLIDVDAVAQAVGPRTKAIMPVHLFGQMAPVEAIEGVARGIPIIEDSAQSQGASRYGRPSGSVGAVAGVSFYPGKNIGAYGDAGAVLTQDATFAEKVRAMANWGSDEKYHHPVLGFNSRLDTIQAVVLSAKLAHLDAWNKQRSAAAEVYDLHFKEEPSVVLPATASGNEHVWHLYVVRVPNRDQVLSDLHDRGVGAGIHYPVPMHLQGALAHLGHAKGDFPVTESAAQEMLSLPLFPGMTESEQAFVIDAFHNALRSANR